MISNNCVIFQIYIYHFSLFQGFWFVRPFLLLFYEILYYKRHVFMDNTFEHFYSYDIAMQFLLKWIYHTVNFGDISHVKIFACLYSRQWVMYPSNTSDLYQNTLYTNVYIWIIHTVILTTQILYFYDLSSFDFGFWFLDYLLITKTLLLSSFYDNGVFIDFGQGIMYRFVL